ncbi:hypothetical protein QBC45DRAFT_78984 [Copromyces sp. CBS 386.78]|nr:hypothetical protein QBC45DRAFT_78984 [Copromyces sp. CBS 386.78]
MGEWYKTLLVLCSCVAEACNVILGPVPVKKLFFLGLYTYYLEVTYTHGGDLFFFLAFNHQHELGLGNTGNGQGISV